MRMLAYSLLLVLMFPASPPAAAAVRPVACPEGTPDIVRCGMLALAERATDGAALETPFIDLTVGAPKAGQPPILFLTGGPGGRVHLETAEDIAAWIALGEQLAPARGGGRRIILMAQRGTAPPLSGAIDCAELYTPELRFGDRSRDPKVRETVAACRARALRLRIDPALFSTAASVADLRTLRQDLEVTAWIPFGFSYGTRLALELARADPDGTAALILDAPDPPGDRKIRAEAENLEAALRRLDRICKAAPACAAKVPDLPDLARQAALRLDQAPKKVTLQFGNGRPGQRVEIDGRDFLNTLSKALRDPSTAEWIPRVVAEGAKGKLKPLTSLLAIVEASPPDQSWGMGIAVDCQDNDARALLATKQASEQASPLYQGIHPARAVFADGLCQAWLGRTPAPPASPPAVFKGPALILSGGLDPVTPQDAANRLAATLGPRAIHLSYPELGHVVTGQAGCTRADVRSFLEGSLKPGVSACDGVIPKLEFPLPR